MPKRKTPTQQASTTGQSQYSLPLDKKYMTPLGRTDDGVDIENAPDGAGVFSITPGVCTAVGSDPTGFGPNYPVIKATAGPLSGQYIYYGHVAQSLVSVGNRVNAGDQIAIMGHTGDAASLGHGHIEIGFSDASGTPLSQGGSASAPGYRMRKVLTDLINGNAISPGGGGNPGGAPTPGVSSSVDVAAVSKAAAISTFINLPGILDHAESLALKGERSLMNDQPLLPFVEQLCQGSLRNFMSMPNGNFFAFIPDYFGGLGVRQPYWQINDIEIISGEIDLSDDALATHVYVVGDTGTIDGQIDILEKMQTAGVVTVFNAFLADFINGVNAPIVSSSGKPSLAAKQKYQKELQTMPSLAEKSNALAFLQKYGARPYYEEAPMIRSHYFEMFLAYQTFCLLWSKQFQTTFEFTFMPELFPGGIVKFPDHGIQCYIDEVTHQGSYTDGFTTIASLSAPTALPNGPGYVHEGMVRSGIMSPQSVKSVSSITTSKGNHGQSKG